MKKYLLAATIMCLVFIACTAPIQLVADLAGNLAASSLKSSNYSQPDLVTGQETEKHQIGKYKVGVSSGSYKNESGTIFMAYDQGMRTKFLFYDKNNSDDMKMMEDFNRMNETEKKLFIKTRFLKIVKLDLGPIEPEIAEKSPAPSFTRDIPTTGFAPAPR